MRVFGRILLRLITIVVIVGLIVGIVGFVLVRRSFPKIDGAVDMPALDAPVTVIRDTEGVPHIYASSTHDLFAAQGYVHAQDRFWQMDFWRHIGQARLSELFGSSQLETDQFLRTLGFARIAQDELDALTPEARAVLDAYTEGVNAYLDERQGTALSFEYGLLKLQNRGYQIEPWQPLDTLTWAKMMSWDLGGNMRYEIERAMLAGQLPVERVDELFPPYPADRPTIIAGGTVTPAESSAFIPDAGGLFAELNDRLNGIAPIFGDVTMDVGSNNWVVSGDLTETGMPLLANDPHLSIQMPSIWYEVGLHCDDACDYNLTGFSFAGVPGVIIGHNDRIAWGVTNLAPDVQDLYVEKINPQNPDQYQLDGQWVDFDVRTEVIDIAGRGSTEIEVRSTVHGPVISGTFEGLDDFDRAGVDVPPEYAVTLQWTALEPTHLVEAVLGLDRAGNWDEFRDALRYWDVPSQNFVYADVDGNIGYQAPGRIPIRSQGDGTWPVPGWTGEYEWDGYIPFDLLPSELNPAEGFIATANEPVIDGSYAYNLGKDFAYGYRAQRILDVLSTAAEPIDFAFMTELQADNRNLSAEEIVPFVLDLNTTEPEAGRAQSLLAEWAQAGDGLFDPSYQQAADLPGAALYASFWKNLLALVFHDEMPEDFWPDGQDRWFVVVRRLLHDPNNAWWDHTETTPVETRDDILEDALLAAMTELRSTLGDDTGSWSWSELHTAEFRNGTFGESGIGPIEWLFNRGPYPVNGGSSIVDATSWDAADGYAVVAIPSMRMIVDLSNFQRSRSIHPTGQSGHIYHRHYIDMEEDWAANIQHPMHWDRTAIEGDAEGTLTLRP